MTEQDWLTCTDPTAMLDFMDDESRPSSRRKFQLCWTGSFRSVWHMLDERVRNAHEVRERYFDGLATEEEHDAAIAIAEAVPHTESIRASDAIPPEYELQVIRDLFGNPFRTVRLDPEWLTWNDGAIRKLAQQIYEERAFDRMSILADALEKAGCTDADILTHCRQSSEHWRGCWVIDLILRKS